MPAELWEKVQVLSVPVLAKAGASIVTQAHKGEAFFLLLDGEVDFFVTLPASFEQLYVGSSSDRFTPVGWSAFKPSERYATSVRARSDSSLLHFDISALLSLFERDPEVGFHFLKAVSEGAERLLIGTREKLVHHLRPGTSLTNWGSAFDRARAITRRARPRSQQVPTAASLAPGAIPSQESMVTNAAPEVEEVLHNSSFFSKLPSQLLDHLCKSAVVHYFCRGDVLAGQGDEADSLLLLADGRVRLEYASAQLRTAVLGVRSVPGTVLSPCSAFGGARHAITVRATRDGAIIKLPSHVFVEARKHNPHFGPLLAKRTLAAQSDDLRTTRAHLVSEAFDAEVLAVESILEQVRTELRVSSPLHKLPHLLKNQATLGDALGTIDVERQSKDHTASHTAHLCHELLAKVRREHRFFTGLAAAYEEVAYAPKETSPRDLRRKSAESFIRVFSEIPCEVRGREFLPKEPGHIFIFNHLKNHEHNTLPNGFQLTLDSHFISAVLLHQKYGTPGLRVVRKSRADEYGHQTYYDRLGHIAVYTPESDSPSEDKSELVHQFIASAAERLSRGENLVIAPEGTSCSTEKSPGRFEAGAFLLAGSLTPEPLIVPVSMAHFDRKLGNTKLAAVVQRPFRISEKVKNVNDPDELRAFLDDFQKTYAAWVRETAALALS